MIYSLFELQRGFSEIQEAYLQEGIEQIERLIEEYELLHGSLQSPPGGGKYLPTGYHRIEKLAGNIAPRGELHIGSVLIHQRPSRNGKT